MDINEQISTNRKRFRVDHFDMVVSEYVNRYLEKNLILDPPYQRGYTKDFYPEYDETTRNNMFALLSEFQKIKL